MDVSRVFGARLFPDPVPGIGYPPPWSLVLALSYLFSYNLFSNLIFYNLATKVPIVIGNILLAVLTGRIVLSEMSDLSLSNGATRFMLFNPYLIYTTAIWGQFDTASALLMLLAMFAVTRGKSYLSAAALGGAIALKLIPAIVLPLLVLYERRRTGWIGALRYTISVVVVIGLSLVPFLVGWSINPVLDGWNVHFVRIGAFSPMSIVLLLGTDRAAGGPEILGYLWIPCSVLIYCVLSKKRVSLPSDLILGALALIMTLCLTRAWVSEQNVNFVLPLLLLATVLQPWPRKWVTATWLLPIIFTFFHYFPLQMLFLVVPESTIGTAYLHLLDLVHAASLDQLRPDLASIVRISITLAWLVVGLALVKKSIQAVPSGKSTTYRAPVSPDRLHVLRVSWRPIGSRFR